MDAVNNKPFTFDRVVRIIISILIIIGVYFLVDSVSAALIPFFIAWLLAYILNPMVEFVQVKMKFKNRLLSIVAVLLFILAVIVGAVLIMIPSVRKESVELVSMISNFLDGNKIVDIIPKETQEQIVAYLKESEVLKSLELNKLTSISSILLKITGGVFMGSYSIVMAILNFFVTMLYLVFILIDFDRISDGTMGLIPEKYRDNVLLVLEDLKINMSRYFRGQSLVAMLVGVLLSIGFSIVGMPLAIPLGLFIGMLNMVPYLQIIGIIPMAILSLMRCASTGESFLMVFGVAILVLCIVQIIQDTIIVPKIMGDVTGLNPAIILLSLSVWGVLLGIIGMIIALPMTTILLSYYKRFIVNKPNN